MEKKINLLIATGIYPPDIGGPATYAKQLSGDLVKNNFYLDVVTYGEEDSVLEDGGHKVYRVSRSGNPVFRYVKYFLKVWSLLNGKDLVFVQGPISDGLPTALAALLKRKKMVMKIVGDHAWERCMVRDGSKISFEQFQKMNHSLLTKVIQMLQRWSSRRAKHIIVPSQYLKNAVSSWGVDKEKISVVYNAISLSGLNIEKNFSHDKDKKFVFLTVGRLISCKEIPDLIKAFSNLKKKHSNIELKIVGEGEERQKIENLIQSTGVQGVSLLGALPHKHVLRLMSECDAFVLNSSHEGLPHVLIEARAMGMPIIATRVGGNPEVIQNGENGLLVESGNQKELEYACNSLIENSELRSKLANSAPKNLKHFSYDFMIRELTKLLQKYA